MRVVLGVAAIASVVARVLGGLAVLVPFAYGAYLLVGPWGVLVPLTGWALLTIALSSSIGQREGVAKSLGCRGPDVAERERLAEAERRLRGRGAVPHRYDLVVIDSDELNAHVRIGRTVAVTSVSATSLPPEQLEAVLAHEFRYYVGWKGRLASVEPLAAIPARVSWWLLRAPWKSVGSMWRRAVSWHRPIGFLLTFLSAVFATVVSVLFGLSAGGAWLLTRAADAATWLKETDADANAARLGLGEPLLAAIEEHIDRLYSQTQCIDSTLAWRASRLRRQIAELGR